VVSLRKKFAESGNYGGSPDPAQRNIIEAGRANSQAKPAETQVGSPRPLDRGGPPQSPISSMVKNKASQARSLGGSPGMT